MRKFKKITALTVGCLLALSLSACGTATNQNQTTGNGTETSAESASSEDGETKDSTGGETAGDITADMTDADILAGEQVILDKGDNLFSGKTDEGYYPWDISWLTGAEEGSSIGIVYANDDPSHGGWGVLGLSVNENQIDIMAYGENTEQERLVTYSMEDLCKQGGVDSPSQITAFSLGAWNGGRIAGFYYLNASLTSELKDYLASVEEATAIVHTYDGGLSNANASAEATALYDYLKDTWGSACITGQMESTWMGSPDYEMNYIEKNTGKLPAIRGLDFMNNDFDGVVERAEAWWEKGGIVTICWHTGADFSSGYNEALSDDIDWDTAFTEGSDAYNALIEGMDRAVPYLQQLEDAGVPVLWRPFHELDGGWFWWSKGGSEGMVKLWQLMYDRYTNYWGLDNLIWVYGYSHNGMDLAKWYPGDEYVDLIGGDSYDAGANPTLYEEVEEVAASGMPIVFHECGNIPTEEQMKEAGTDWLYFMTWHTDYITDTQYNAIDTLNEIYNGEYFITLDELPDFTN